MQQVLLLILLSLGSWEAEVFIRICEKGKKTLHTPSVATQFFWLINSFSDKLQLT